MYQGGMFLAPCIASILKGLREIHAIHVYYMYYYLMVWEFTS